MTELILDTFYMYELMAGSRSLEYHVRYHSKKGYVKVDSSGLDPIESLTQFQNGAGKSASKTMKHSNKF